MMKSFPHLLEDYILIHLMKERRAPKPTVHAYYAAIAQYVTWLREEKMFTEEQIDASCFGKDSIKEFLSMLEEHRHISAGTYNLRKAGIQSFLDYASDVEPVYMNASCGCRRIKNRKIDKKTKDFLTVEEYEALLNCIDTDVPEGNKHYVMLYTLYETAARVSELVSMNIEDFSFGRENSVLIYGKGSKYRRVYFGVQTARLLQEFIKSHPYGSGPLFRKRSGMRMSDSGVDYILKKYVAIAAQITPGLRTKKISPHTMRRTKSTHILLNGISLPVIQRFLGHESITTTEKYLELGSSEMIETVKQMEKMVSGNETVECEAIWKQEDVLSRLKSLIK